MSWIRFWMLIIGVVCLKALPAAGQVNLKATPYGLSGNRLSPAATVATLPLDLKALLAEDNMEEAMGLPFRFGYPFEVAFNLENSGEWTELGDGGRIWGLRIVCPGAYSINLVYSRFYLPDGARLFLYDESQQFVRGAFTSRNNKEHRQFATAPTPGAAVILEYYEPSAVRGQGELEIGQIVHGYKDIFEFGGDNDVDGYGESGACNININCPEGAPWRNEARAVAMILVANGTRICTGTLVNNVRQDQTPYFLTAYHCLGSEATWIFMFNYESDACVNVNGPTDMTVSGSVRRALNEVSDFALLELLESPPPEYKPYFAGWSNLDLPSDSSVTIHHPSGDIKKISFDYEPLISTDYLNATGTSHWRVIEWDRGTTEVGSSGAPLFDRNHHLVGQLHGGFASCANTLSDWYGKFSYSWNAGETPSSRLRDWLDPDNVGAATLNGFDPFAGINIVHFSLPDTYDTVNSYEVLATISSPSPLIPESTLLYFEINPPSVLQSLLMTATGNPNRYHAFIPAQKPGTEVQYYIQSVDNFGRRLSTDYYRFTVNHSPIIAVSSENLAVSLNAGDTAVVPLTVTNLGQGLLNYDITVNYAFHSNTRLEALKACDALEPAQRVYPEGFDTVIQDKNVIDTREGFIVTKDAGGPDNFGYFWVDSDDSLGPVFDWIDITAFGTDITAGMTDDSYVGPFPLNFVFPYYGGSFSQIYVGSNGLVGFYPLSLDSYQRVHIPSAATPNGMLAWLWDDLDITNPGNPGGRILFYSNSERAVIQFFNYPEYNGLTGDVVNAEVILYAGGLIKFQYMSIGTGFDTRNCAVGIENASGTDGLEVAYLTDYLHDSLAIAFYLPEKWLTLSSLSGTLAQNETDTIRCWFDSRDLASGVYNAAIAIKSNDPDSTDNPWVLPVSLMIIGDQQFICGDVDANGRVNILDATYLIRYLYRGGESPSPREAGDLNGSGEINLVDIIYLVSYLFKEGQEPTCPEMP
ncbi:MAG: trypsin-like peptidase domain-containing protein [bacterium]